MFAAYSGHGARYGPHRDNARRSLAGEEKRGGAGEAEAPHSAPPSHVPEVEEEEEALLNDRAVTLILYLNERAGWGEETGGGLRIHPEAAQEADGALFASGWQGGVTGGGGAGSYEDVLPVAGNIAIFRSELLHEVMPTADGRQRLALSLWCVR